MQENNIDSENHFPTKKTLEILLSYSYQEYKHLATDRQNIQLAYLKTYISLSSIIIGAIVSSIVFFNFISDSVLICPKSWPEFFSFIFISISFILAIVIFIAGVDLLRGRENRPIPFGNINSTLTWIKEQNTALISETALEIEFLETSLKIIAESLEKLIKITERIGIKLRIISLGLIGAMLFGLVGILIRLFLS